MAEVQSRGLEALSTAALYTPPNAPLIPETAPYTDDDFENIHTTPLDDGKALAVGSPPPANTDPAPSSRNLDLILNPASTLSPRISPALHHAENDGHMADTFQGFSKARGSHLKASTETDLKTAFLLRHFSEVTGQWMDLFDQTAFFGSYIPVKSISNPLLKNAACAYAAKQLARVNGAKTFAGGLSFQQSRMQLWEGVTKQNWALLAAEYYDGAISLLKESLQWDHSPSGDNSSEEIDKRLYGPRTVEGMVEERKLRRRQFGSAQSTARSDDLLAATAILCEYESLDASKAAWAHHLSGTKSLLDVVEVGMMPLDSPEVPFQKKTPSQARKATFWNFARQDLFAAFVHECRTRLDTEDVSLWRDNGLLLDENDLVVPSNAPESEFSRGNFMREDMIGNALIWLVSKLMNLLCVDETAPVNNQHSLSAKWARLNYEMEVWFNGLPETFMPSAIIPVHPHGTNLTEVWSSIPVCTATVMTWHMAQVLMLVNKPPDVPTRRPTVAERMKSYRNIGQEIAFHSRQILGLCLARPEASVRIHGLQPVFVAGQCLTEMTERKVVVDLLRGIETDLGWATEYRVQQLLQEWGWKNGNGEGVPGQG
ncbi:MAG: hypothetical protein Q9225_001549 [Loekoesia sp. 1 TL-2023]